MPPTPGSVGASSWVQVLPGVSYISRHMEFNLHKEIVSRFAGLAEATIQCKVTWVPTGQPMTWQLSVGHGITENCKIVLTWNPSDNKQTISVCDGPVEHKAELSAYHVDLVRAIEHARWCVALDGVLGAIDDVHAPGGEEI